MSLVLCDRERFDSVAPLSVSEMTNFSRLNVAFVAQSPNENHVSAKAVSVERIFGSAMKRGITMNPVEQKREI